MSNMSYSSITGSLMYEMICNMSNIVCIVGVVSEVIAKRALRRCKMNTKEFKENW